MNKKKEWIFCCCTNGVWQNEAFLPLESTLLNILNAATGCTLIWRLWKLWIGLARVHFPAYLQPTTHDAALLTASLFERDLVQLPSSPEYGTSTRLRQAERVSAAEMRARPETRPAEKENVRHNRFPCSLPAQYLRLPDQTSLRNLEQDAVLNW